MEDLFGEVAFVFGLEFGAPDGIVLEGDAFGLGLLEDIDGVGVGESSEGCVGEMSEE